MKKKDSFDTNAMPETEEQKAKKVKKLRSARNKNAIALRAVLIVLIVLLSLACIAVFALKITGLADFGKTAPTKNIETSVHNPIVRDDGSVAQRQNEVYNFLIVGQDKKANLTDVMMIMNFDVTNSSITLMQFPRDTLITAGAYACMDCKKPVTTAQAQKGNCPSCGAAIKTITSGYQRKLNSVYGTYYSALNGDQKDRVNFGMKGLSLTFEQVLNINIDYYAHMDLEGFRDIVDIIGGVDMYVPYTMYYRDPAQNLYINLKEGQQTLDGEKAEQFVRFRSGYLQADLARQDAQKLFMVAFFENFKEKISITNVFSIVSTMMEKVTHSVPVEDLDYFGRKVLSMDFSNITMLSAPNTTTNINGGSYVILHRYALLKIINQHFNLYDSDIPDEQFDTDKSFTITNSSSAMAIYNSLEEFEGTHTADDIQNNGLDIGLAY